MATRRGLLVHALATLTIASSACSSSGGSTTITAAATSAAASTGTTATGGATTSAGGASTSGAGGGAASTTCGTTKLVVGLDTDPVQIDPQQLPQTLGAYTLIDAVYDTLAYPTENGPAPRLATSWTESADRLTWTIKIRTGVTFTDGTALTAEHVKQNLNAQRGSTTNGPAISNMSFIDAPDAETVTVKLKTPWAAFPSVLTQFYTSVARPAALAGGALARKPEGTGPFTLTEWKPNDRVLLTCNGAYWGDRPRVGTVELRFIPDETARLAALRAGDIDAAWLLIKDSIEGAQADKSVRTFRGPYAGQSISLFNSSKPPFDDVRLRRAIAMAIDTAATNAAFGTPGSEPAVGPFSKQHPWFTATDYPTYDPAGAKQLVDAHAAEHGGAKPSFTYSYTAGGNQLIDDVVAALKQYWEAAGFAVKLDKQVDATGYVTQVVLGNFEAAGWVAGMDLDPDLTLFNAYHELGAFNFGRYRNTELSGLLDKGRQSASEADRRDAYTKALAVIGRDVPVLFGTFSGSWVAVSERVTGMEQFKTFVFPTRLVGVTG